MLAKDFVIQLEENYKFNGASNLGASIPADDDEKINESRFSHELRAKEIKMTIQSDNSVMAYWISQSWDDDTMPFFTEIKRWANYWATKLKLEEQVEMNIFVSCRNVSNTTQKSHTFIINPATCVSIDNLIEKYCNGTDDIKLFYSILYLIGDISDFDYKIAEDEEEVSKLDLDALINAFVDKADFNSIATEDPDQNDTVELIDAYMNDDYNGGQSIHYAFYFDPDECETFTQRSAKILGPFLEANRFITDPGYPNTYFRDNEVYEDYKFRCDYASEYFDGLDIDDFLKYLKDIGLDVYTDDNDIVYIDKTVYTFEDNIYTKQEADEIVSKIKSKIRKIDK